MLIKNGDDGYLPQLWEQTRRFITMKAKEYYNKYDRKSGVEVEDLVQSGYFALLEAVEYYVPEKGYKYLTFLDKTLKRAFRETFGIRTSKRDMLNFAVSLDAPINENGDITLLDSIGDLTPDGGDVQAEVIESVYHLQLRQALDNAMSILSNDNRAILEFHYYFGLSFRELAEKRGVSHIAIESKVYHARLRIYKSSHKSILETFLHYDKDNPYAGTGYQSWKHSGYSAVESAALRKETHNARRYNQPNSQSGHRSCCANF